MSHEARIFLTLTSHDGYQEITVHILKMVHLQNFAGAVINTMSKHRPIATNMCLRIVCVKSSLTVTIFIYTLHKIRSSF